MDKYFQYQIGMQVNAPTQHILIQIPNKVAPRSIWVRKREAIIDKMKAKKVLRNYFIKIVLFILSLPITTAIWLAFLSLATRHVSENVIQIYAILVGILIPLTWILSYYFISDYFQTNWYFVTVKHRGKYL